MLLLQLAVLRMRQTKRLLNPIRTQNVSKGNVYIKFISFKSSINTYDWLEIGSIIQFSIWKTLVMFAYDIRKFEVVVFFVLMILTAKQKIMISPNNFSSLFKHFPYTYIYIYLVLIITFADVYVCVFWTRKINCLNHVEKRNFICSEHWTH